MSTSFACVDVNGNQHFEPLTLVCSSPDAKKLIHFYRQLGLKISPVQREATGLQSVLGHCPGFTAKFIGGPKTSREPTSPLCFLVDDVKATVKALMPFGGRPVGPARETPGKPLTLVLADPEGRQLTLMQHLPVAPGFGVAAAAPAVRRPASPSPARPISRKDNDEDNDEGDDDDDETSSGKRRRFEPITRNDIFALRTGAICHLLGIALIFAAIVSLQIQPTTNPDSNQTRRITRPGAAAPMPPVPIVSLAIIVGSIVVQTYGKVRFLEVAEGPEGSLLVLTIVLQFAGVACRMAALWLPNLAGILFWIAAATHIDLLLFAFFFWRLTSRIGSRTALYLSRTMFGSTCLMFLAAPRLFWTSRQGISEVFAQLLFIGGVSLLLLVAVLLLFSFRHRKQA